MLNQKNTFYFKYVFFLPAIEFSALILLANCFGLVGLGIGDKRCCFMLNSSIDDVDGDEVKIEDALARLRWEDDDADARPFVGWPAAAIAAINEAAFANWLFESWLPKIEAAFEQTFLCLFKAVCVLKLIEHKLQLYWDCDEFWLDLLLLLLLRWLDISALLLLPFEFVEWDRAAWLVDEFVLFLDDLEDEPDDVLAAMWERLWRHKFENCVYAL